MSCRLVPKAVTLNNLERRNGVMALILRYFTEVGSFWGPLRQSQGCRKGL